MINVIVLGSTGMLGSQVTKVLSEMFNVTEANRSGAPVVSSNKSIEFDARNLSSISKVLENQNEYQYIINCVGSIKQLISESNESIQNAIAINSILPYILEEYSRIKNFRIIQICTDCVFSGKTGGSCESTPHDCLDTYGRTKSLGELSSRNIMNIRCSIVGREINSNNSLLEWFLSRPLNSKISGYSNHFWNGVTTWHFAEVIQGIILKDGFTPGTFHLVPADQISKFELLSIFANEYNRNDLHIESIETEAKIDRTLSSIYPEVNSRMWTNAGYLSPPTIQSMIGKLRIKNETEKNYG